MSTPLESVICPAAGISPSLRSHMERLLAEHPDSPVWQSAWWNAMLSRAGMQEEGWYVGVHEGSTPVAYCLLEVRSVGLGLRAGFVLGGPVGELDESVAAVLSASLLSLSRRLGLVFTQYEPLSDIVLPGFALGHYRKFIERSTVRIDLEWADEEQVLAGMHHK